MVLITCGNGKLGKRIAPRLQAIGEEVRIGSRSGSPAFDWDKPDTWKEAVQGVDTCMAIFSPDLAVPQAAEIVGEFAELATKAGVRRIVLLSGRGEEGAIAAENAVADIAKEWTVLRCSWFNQNFSESVFLDSILAREVYLPIGPVIEPFIDLDDVAEVAEIAITQSSHLQKVLELTGPRLMTFADAIQDIAHAIQTDIRFETIPMEAFVDALKAGQLPEDAIELIRYLFTEVLDGRNASKTDTLENVLGRPARDLKDYALHTAKSGVWEA